MGLTKQQLAQLLASNPTLSDDEIVTLARQQAPATISPIDTAKKWAKGAWNWAQTPLLDVPETGNKWVDYPAMFVEGMSSPANIALTVAAPGASLARKAGMWGLSKAALATEAGLNAAYGAQGVNTLANAKSLPEAAIGAVETGLSALGLGSAAKGARKLAAARSLGDAGELYASQLDDILRTHQEHGGSTFNAKGNQAGVDAYSVGGVVPEEVVDELTPEVLKSFITKNSKALSQPSRSLGTWRNSATGKTHLDITDLMPKDEAIKLGKQRKQLAIFGLKDFDEIPLGDAIGNASGMPSQMPSTAGGGLASTANALAGPGLMVGSDPIAASLSDDPETQAAISAALKVAGGGATIGMAARGFNPKVLAGMKQRVMEQVQRDLPESADTINSVLGKYKSAGLLGEVASGATPEGQRFVGKANATYANLPPQAELEALSQSAFGRPIGQLNVDEALQLVKEARKRYTTHSAGLGVTNYKMLLPGTIEHEMGHLGQDLAKGGMLRDAPVRNVPYPVQPHEVGARVREKKVGQRELGQAGGNTRQQWIEELERVNEANKEKFGAAAALPPEMDKARQRLMGYVPGNVADGPLQQVVPTEDVRHLRVSDKREVGAFAKQTKTAVKQRQKKLQESDWDVPEGPFLDRGINLNERTIDKKQIVQVVGKGKKKSLALTPYTQNRLDALLGYAEEKGMGGDWKDTAWMEMFNDPREAKVFAQLWGATSPQNDIAGNFGTALDAFVKNTHGVPVKEMGRVGNFGSWANNVERAIKGEPLSGQKVANMAAALEGDLNAVPIDTHFMRALGWHPQAPPSGAFYDHIKDAFSQWAVSKGMTPFEAMAKVWAATRELTGRTKGDPVGVSEAFKRTGLTQPSLFTGNPLMRFGRGAASLGGREIDLEAVSQPALLELRRSIAPLTAKPSLSEMFPATPQAAVPEGQLSLGAPFTKFANPSRQEELRRIRQAMQALGINP